MGPDQRFSPERAGSPAGPDPLAFLDDRAAARLLTTLTDPAAPADPGTLATVLADYRLVRQVLDHAMLGVAVFDRHLRYRYVNPVLAAINGVPATDHVGRRIGEVVPDIDVAAAEATLRTVLADGRARAHTVRGTTAAGPPDELRWWHNAFHRLDGRDGRPLGLVAMVLEITEDRRIREALDRASTRLALLEEAATRIGTTLDVEQAAQELARLLAPRLAEIASVDLIDHQLSQHEGLLMMRRLALSGTPELMRAGGLFGAAGTVQRPQPGSALARCVASTAPVVLNFATDEEIRGAAAHADRLPLYRSFDLHSAVFVPLTAGGTVLGVVSLGRTGAAPGFTPDEVALIAELAERAGSGIGNAQRYAREHETALALQRALLSEPMSPHPDVACAIRYLPAGATAEVGGDWYDTVALPGGRTLLVVGDVMGHGLDAAATMSEYRSLIRALALQRRSPSGILDEAARIVEALAPERVATCVLALLDPPAGTCTLASAGHLPPLLLGRTGPARLVPPPVGPPLGAGLGGYRCVTVPFDADSTVLLYTDGLVERRGIDIEECLAALCALPLDPAAPLEHLIDTALTGLAAGHGEDDVAVLAARWSGTGPT
ncbi:SpoIIE family protein phosphatase [Kitasatospora viridis]|uniref:PAS domain S-box-containing protein n=1 Tax=Kitasatospora viridis TaxID=281105 RepID=A0A561UPF3_9ACTN|nr:SpoIIE family protein phosphatase [Kitasatospora viridis]TWG01256.1 PAS domain S-box-containing protein [Kitasatospora viridis]